MAAVDTFERQHAQQRAVVAGIRGCTRHDRARPRTIATSAEAMSINNVTTESGSVANADWRRRATVDVDRLEACIVELRGKQTFVRARVSGEPDLIGGAGTGLQQVERRLEVAMSMIANLPLGARETAGDGRRAHLQPAAAGLDRDDAVDRGSSSRWIHDRVQRRILAGADRSHEDGDAEQRAGDPHRRIRLNLNNCVGRVKPVDCMSTAVDWPSAVVVWTWLSTTSIALAASDVVPSPM